MGSALTDKGRIGLLNYAYDQGVYHFDTAPLYGMGHAERVLGKFIKHKRSQVTIATKYGLDPVKLPSYSDPLVAVGRYLNRRSKTANKLISALQKQKLSTTKKASNAGNVSSINDNKHNTYNLSALEHGLHHSLRELGTDYIDIYLLHECQLSYLNDEVVDGLNKLVESGKLLAYGLATNRTQANSILEQFPQFKGVIQVPYSIFSEEVDKVTMTNNLLTISHSVFTDIWPKVHAFLKADRQHVSDWSKALDYDLSVDDSLAKILFAQALHEHHDGIVLFSSASRKNIKSNCDMASKKPFKESQHNRFKQLVQQQVFAQQ